MIFDCDGVLVDSETITHRTIVDQLAVHGFHIIPDQCSDLFVGGTMKSAGEEAIRRGAALPEDWADRTLEAVLSALRTSTPVIPNVIPFLDWLDACGVPYCVASNGPLSKMEVTLSQNGLWDRFEGRRWSSHDVGEPKPQPGLFLYAANAMGVLPEACVVIEDSRSGALAAQRAGMRCLGYAAQGGADKLRSVGAEVFHDMADLPALLEL